jgi:hypothetical protein
MGCVGSLHPLYAGKDTVFDPALLGKWKLTDEQTTFTVTPWDESRNSYRIVCTAENSKDSCEFHAYLVKVKGDLFLDALLEKFGVDEDYRPFIIPLHHFARLRQVEGEWEMCTLNYEWLEDYLDRRKCVVKHEVMDDGTIVLTAQPKGLQRFLIRHLNTKDAFTDWSKVDRVASPS